MNMTTILVLAELNISPKIQWSQLKALALAEQQSKDHNLFHSQRRVPFLALAERNCPQDYNNCLETNSS